MESYRTKTFKSNGRRKEWDRMVTIWKSRRRRNTLIWRHMVIRPLEELQGVEIQEEDYVQVDFELVIANNTERNAEQQSQIVDTQAQRPGTSVLDMNNNHTTLQSGMVEEVGSLTGTSRVHALSLSQLKDLGGNSDRGNGDSSDRGRTLVRDTISHTTLQSNGIPPVGSYLGASLAHTLTQSERPDRGENHSADRGHQTEPHSEWLQSCLESSEIDLTTWCQPRTSIH
jgi:hypothetical protein